MSETKKTRSLANATKKIVLLAKTNPKKGASQVRFALYTTGMTVAEYVAAGGRSADIKWDLERNFIQLVDEMPVASSEEQAA